MNANWNMYNIYKNEIANINIKIVFLNQAEWVAFNIQDFDDNRWFYNQHPEIIRHFHNTRAITDQIGDGTIYIKESAKKDPDFRFLLLHELGHAICDLNHINAQGNIMNFNFKQWTHNIIPNAINSQIRLLDNKNRVIIKIYNCANCGAEFEHFALPTGSEHLLCEKCWRIN